jgi:predicted nuclease of predicted toxin-antitoxin system
MRYEEVHPLAVAEVPAWPFHSWPTRMSRESAAHLETLGYPCRSLCREGPRRLSDREIVALAKREECVILTHDLDFGQIYYFAEEGQVGILVLRLRHQTVEIVNDVLQRFLRSEALSQQQLRKSLVILSETTYRVYQGPRGEF